MEKLSLAADVYVCVYVCMDVWMDGWMDVCMCVCMDVCMYVCIVAFIYVRYSTVYQSCGLVIRVMLRVQYQRAQKG